MIDSRGGYFSHQKNKPSQHGHQSIGIEIRSIIVTAALDHLRDFASNSPRCVGVNGKKNRTQIFYFRFLSSLSLPSNLTCILCLVSTCIRSSIDVYNERKRYA